MSFKDIAFVLLFLGAWIVLNRWILPRFGISTCMSGSCAVDPPLATRQKEPDQADRQDPVFEARALPDHRPEHDGAQTVGDSRQQQGDRR
jgi:hypothetical protein